jgi:hypothetical protein
MKKTIVIVAALAVIVALGIITTSVASVLQPAQSPTSGALNIVKPQSTVSTRLREAVKDGLVPGLPEKPQVSTVEFANNTAVLVDTQPNEPDAPEEGLAINEYPKDAGTDVAWEYASGKVVKNWPIAYPEKTAGKPTMIKLDAKFTMGKDAEEFLEKMIEGETEIVGELTLAAAKLEFKEKFKTPAELVAELKSAGHLSTGNVESTVAIPQEVALYGLDAILWKLVGTETGGKKFNESMGESQHNIFVTYLEPSTKQTNQTFLTLLYLSTVGVEKVKKVPTEAEAITGVWNAFSTDKMELVEYNVATGVIKNKPGTVLEYYKNIAPAGQTAEEEMKKASSCSSVTVPELLHTKEGQCAAWASAFGYSLGYQGIHSDKVEVTVNFGAGSECTAKECDLLVKIWKFKPCPGMKKPPLTYLASEVTDVAGAPAQGTTDPNSAFELHYLVQQGKTLYDPSYGTAPITAATKEEALEKYQATYLAGFCNTAKNKCGEVSEASKKALVGSEVYEY